MSRSTKVFLSYARGDGSELVKQVLSYLKLSGTEGWVDVIDIPAGDDWREKLDSAIRDSDALVLIMTPKAIESKYVQEEFRIAAEYQKRLIPLAMEDVKKPDWLGNTEYIRFKQFDDATALGKLSGGLKTVWESVEERINDLRINVVPDELAPVLDQLQTYLRVSGRPIVRPEVLLACVEFVERLSNPPEDRSLTDVIADWRGGAYDTAKLKYRAAYEKNTPTIKKILNQALKGLPTPEVKRVPFVLVVMTAEEAQELESETVFKDSTENLRIHYKNVLKKLHGAGIADWVTHYRPRPEQWKPFVGQEKTLERLIAEELGRPTNEAAPELRRPVFIDIRTINDRPDDLADLRQAGCVVIMDVISVCHPQLLMKYRQSLLDIFPATFLIKMGPLDPVPVFGEGEDESTTLLWVQRADSFFYERHKVKLDPNCHVAGHEDEFRRFMRQKVLTGFLKSYTGVRQYIHGAGS
jgi:hypothetical protein